MRRYQVIACQIATNVTAGGFATDRNTNVS
jgi:hypothetical protein